MVPNDRGEPALPEPPAATESAAPARPAGGAVVDELELALARRARAGDRDAFARLYERRGPMVHGVLISMVSPQEASDLVQEVFLRALRSVGELRPETVGPWLCAIARNCARDSHRARRARRGEVELGEATEPSVEASGSSEDEEEALRALAVLRALPEAYRETLSLRLVEGLSGPEIAAATGMTHGSVRVNLHRGMKLLREKLG